MSDLFPGNICAQMRNGDFESFEWLFNTYWDELFQYAARILGSQDDAQDIVQDLFVNIWERRSSLDVNTSIRNYLFSATRKKILCKFRDDGLKEKHLEQFILNGELRAELTLSKVINKDIRRQLQSDLQRLPEKERQVFEWYHFEELSIREIAHRNGTAEQTVRNQLGKAYQKARPILNKLLMFM